MISQSNLIFKLGTLEVHSFSAVSAPSTPVYPHTGQLTVRMTEEIWWRDENNPNGFGPFETIYAAVKHYENYKNNLSLASSPSSLIKVDFKNKKRLDLK